MKDTKQYQLISKVLSNQATASELNDFNQWLGESDSNKDYYSVIEKLWVNSIITDEVTGKQKVFDRVMDTISEGNTKPENRNKLKYWVAAASLFIILSLSIVFYNTRLDNNRVVGEVVVPNTIIKQNPSGQKSKIMLSDGSLLWLNSESSIQFSEGFTDSLRKIHLQGEAYFEVKKEHRPFIVSTDNIEVKVLGTSFNVNAYANEETNIVSLASGKVELINKINQEIHTLDPGWQIVYSADTITRKQVAIEVIGEWKDGIISFENDNFEFIVKRLERYYGVKFKYVDGQPEKSWRYTGRFENEYLVNILDIISYGKKFTYSIEGKKIILNFKP